MNCSKCGRPLTGTENVCPNCKNPIKKIVLNNEPELLEEEPKVIEEQVTVVTEKPIIQPQKPELEEKPKSNKALIIIITLVVLAVIAVVLFFTVFSPKSTSSKTKENEVVEKPVTETYAGYTFIIPKGYTAKNDPKYGLMISNSTTIFTISIDYSNKYEDYKTELMAKYKDQADELVANVEGREYLALIFTEETGAEATEYISKAGDKTTFVGMVVRSDFKSPTTIEFTKLSEILKNAKQESTPINPGDENDAGKNGKKIYSYTKNEFTFEK